MEANNFLPIGEVAKGSPCSPKPTRATTLRTRLSCADVIRDGGVPSSPPASTLPATEQWVGELLALFARPAAHPCQYLDSLKGPVVRKVVTLAAFLGFAHGVSALAFPLIVPSNLWYTCEHSLQGRAQILTPGW